ncbi:hypothetical protein BH20ACT23_BH20ACT23_13520 [soil metagenome]
MRQLASPARRSVEEQKPRFEASRAQRERLADRFFAAVEEGDLGELESLLASEVELHGDGGGKAPAIARPLQGRNRVAQLLLAWWRAATRFGGATVRRVEVNGQPGAMTLDSDGRLISVIAVDIAGGHIERVTSLVNPDKLDHLGLPVADLGALLRAASSQTDQT